MWHQLLFAVLLPSCLAAERLAEPVVQVEHGRLLGTQVAGARGPFYAFRGIPYAAAPVGSLRFKAPRPPQPWSGIRNATVEGSSCVQSSFEGEPIGTEDCLFINVYTPQLKCSSRLPVIVFIHASAFIFGSGNSDWYGPDFIVSNGVILVTLNHRLGPLGFLNLETPGAPGNAGMKDTLAALQWVKKNIHAFCGDETKVTLGGHSAGAMIANTHVLNPKSANLFQRAILMSYNPLTPKSYSERNFEAAQELATILGAKNNDTASLERTLRSATAEQINKAHFTMLMREAVPNALWKFAVSIENRAASEADMAGSTFMTSSPEALLRYPQVKNQVPILTGTVALEGGASYALGLNNPVINKNESALLPRLISRFPEILQRSGLYVPRDVASAEGVSRGPGTAAQQQQILKLVQNAYFGGKSTFNREQYMRVISDMEFVGPVVNYLRFCRGPVFLYETDVKTSYNFVARLFNLTFLTQAIHADDLGYIFRPHVVDLQQDYEGTGVASSVLRYMTTMVTDFAKGKPVGAPAICGAPSHPYIHINGSHPAVAQDYGRGAALWKRVYDIMRHHHK